VFAPVYRAAAVLQAGAALLALLSPDGVPAWSQESV
jgi:hypothetical protein